MRMNPIHLHYGEAQSPREGWWRGGRAVSPRSHGRWAREAAAPRAGQESPRCPLVAKGTPQQPQGPRCACVSGRANHTSSVRSQTPLKQKAQLYSDAVGKRILQCREPLDTEANVQALPGRSIPLKSTSKSTSLSCRRTAVGVEALSCPDCRAVKGRGKAPLFLLARSRRLHVTLRAVRLHIGTKDLIPRAKQPPFSFALQDIRNLSRSRLPTRSPTFPPRRKR